MKDKTLNYYNENAKEYFDATFSIDMTDLYKGFLDNMIKGGRILDLGCGSGRDSLYFKNNGYLVTAVDGCEQLAKEAEELISEKVIVSTFEDLKLEEKYDGIWACASLLHVNRDKIISLLRKLSNNLKESAVFYISFKYGENEYIDNKGRYFNCYTEDSFIDTIKGIKELKIKSIYKSGDTLKGRDSLLWLNILLEKE